MIQATCPECGQSFDGPDKYAGKATRCPSCKTGIVQFAAAITPDLHLQDSATERLIALHEEARIRDLKRTQAIRQIAGSVNVGVACLFAQFPSEYLFAAAAFAFVGGGQIVASIVLTIRIDDELREQAKKNKQASTKSGQA